MIDNFGLPINDVMSFTISDIESLIIRHEKMKRKKMDSLKEISDKVMINANILDLW